MNSKAQGAIEYLLIIGAAILVVSIVIVAMTSVVGTGKNQAGPSDVNSGLDELKNLIKNEKGVLGAECASNSNCASGYCGLNSTPNISSKKICINGNKNQYCFSNLGCVSNSCPFGGNYGTCN
ncbi:MAG: class III signal peptide-containing protein [archaeon]|jgi:hypothetical protein